MPDLAARALSFGAIADAYDRIRPGYPPELFDDLLAFAGPVRRVLEVGAGTGRATAALADRGLAVHAVEPDPEMAALLAARLVDRPLVSVTVAGFEQQPADGGYDLVVSAQAWHWVDPHVRWERAADTLRRGGTLALFWNHNWVEDVGLAQRLQAAHDRLTPGIRIDDSLPAGDLRDQWPGPSMAKRREFTDLTVHRYPWQRTLTAADYVELLGTMSAYNVRPAGVREELFAEVLDMVGDDDVVVAMETLLYLARRT